MQVNSILILERRVTLAEVGLGFPALQSNTAVSAKPKQLPIRNKVTVNTSCNACHEGQVILIRTHLSSPILTKPHNYSELFHMPYLDAWALPWSALLEWIQWCCTNLFHAFSPDQLNGSVTQLNRKTRSDHCSPQLFIQGHGSGTVWIITKTQTTLEQEWQ